jgi:hypothetical protein
MKPKHVRIVDGIPCMTVIEHDHIVSHAVEAEREACAQLVEHFDSTNPTLLAEAIRKRSEI